MKALLGKKIGMSQIFQDNKVVPVTLVEAGPCTVARIRTKDADGYSAVQVGYEEITREGKIRKSIKKVPFASVVEFRPFFVSKDAGITENQGDIVDVSVFEEGDMVQVSGISKGKGFQGGVKRHGMHGRNATHGVKHEERTIGSVGSAYPQRVIKGRKMPGRMGADRVTVKNLKIAKVDLEHNMLAIKGAVPGRRGTLLEIRG
jgi:large subunit ribosomal protein L3